MRNILKEKLARGEKPLGTFVGTGSAAVVECLGCAGLDFAILDNEHSPIEAETTARLVCAAERRNITPLARVLKDAYGLVERPCGAEPIQGCDVILYQTSRRLPPYIQRLRQDRGRRPGVPDVVRAGIASDASCREILLNSCSALCGTR